MKTEIKIILVVLIVAATAGLGWVYHAPTAKPITVSLEVSPEYLKHKNTRVVLQASAGRNGVSHGEVKLDFIPAHSEAPMPGPGNACCIQGYTNTHGVFITDWAPRAAGEYIVSASVKKPGFVDGHYMGQFRVSGRQSDMFN